MSVKTPVKDLDTCTTTGCYVTTHNATGLPDKTGEAPCVVFRVYNKGIPCALQILFHGSILYVRLVWVGGITSWSKFNPSNEAISTGSNF